MAKYRIGVIGFTGQGGYGHHLDRGWLHVPNCEVVAVADPHAGGRAAKARELKAKKAYADYRKLMDEAKPDIVAICTRWLDRHRDIVLAAAERGIHIYMEKPMCRSLEEADQMAAACDKKNVKFAIAYVTRYSPTLHVVRELIEDGRIGELLELRGRGKEDRRGGGEDLWVLGSHIMNMMHFLGGDPRWCFATALQDGKPVTRAHVKPGNEGIGPLAGDWLNAMYGMQDGVTAYFGTRRNMAGRRFGLQVLGSKGMIDITTGYLPRANLLEDPSWSPGRSGKKWVPITSGGVGKPEPRQDPGRNGGNIAACKDLIRAIEDDSNPEADLHEARVSTEMIIGVFESHRVGGPVPMPLKNRKNPLTML